VKHNQDHKQNVGNSEKPLDDNLLEDGNSSNSQELPNDNQQQSGNQLPKIKNMKPEGNPQVDTKKPQNMSIQDGQNKVVELPKDASSKAAINSKANPSDNNVNKDGKLAVDQSEANKVINSDSRVAKTKSIIQLTPIVTNVKKAQNVVTANNKVHTATTQKMQKVKASTSTTKNKQHKANKQLPKTGESTPATTPILGAVLSLLGTLTLIGRRKKQQD
jgi:LPXTG-motif cell wall-anchored protein